MNIFMLCTGLRSCTEFRLVTAQDCATTFNKSFFVFGVLFAINLFFFRHLSASQYRVPFVTYFILCFMCSFAEIMRNCRARDLLSIWQLPSRSRFLPLHFCAIYRENFLPSVQVYRRLNETLSKIRSKFKPRGKLIEKSWSITNSQTIKNKREK